MISPEPARVSERAVGRNLFRGADCLCGRADPPPPCDGMRLRATKRSARGRACRPAAR